MHVCILFLLMNSRVWRIRIQQKVSGLTPQHWASKTTADTPLTYGVVAPGIVVGGILLAADELLGVEELAVGPGSNLVHNRRFQVDKHRPNIEKNIVFKNPFY